MVTRYYFRHVSWITVSHQFVLTLLFVSLLLFVPERSSNDDDPHQTILRSAIAVPLIVPTRLIAQFLLLRLFGAEHLVVSGAWGPVFPRVIAPRLLLSSHQFLASTMAPFIVISMLFHGIMVVFPGLTVVSSIGVLANGLLSVGDIALANVLWFHRKEEIYTFDDEEGGVTIVAHIPTDGNPT